MAEPEGADDAPAGTAGERLTWRRRGRWLLLAFVPVSLMLGVTLYMSVYVAPIPLFWVIPLALYLVTFILAFGRPRRGRERWLVRLLPVGLLPLAVCLILQITDPIFPLLLLHLATFFVGALICHTELARDRPAPAHLTEFYLWISTGGALGGIFNGLLAPLLFPGEWEYPVALVLLCLLLPIEVETGGGRRAARERERTGAGVAVWLNRMDLLQPAVLAVLLAAGVLTVRATGAEPDVRVIGLLVIVPALVVMAFGFLRRPVRFALGLAALLIAGSWLAASFITTYHQERTFFGVHRVISDPTGQFISLVHGSVVHGTQSLDRTRRDEPTTYYSRTGPVGQVFSAYRDVPGRQVGVVGLGAGSMACYREADQRWTFFEIDPAVVRIATDPKLFTYLSDCTPDAAFRLGDGRLTVSREPDGTFHTLVLDAYTSDALPVHLLTREAVAMFFRKLQPGGLLLFNISNKYADLEPVLGSVAADGGYACLIQSDQRVPAAELRQGKYPSTWVVMARTTGDVQPLTGAPNSVWKACASRGPAGVWTDDRLSVAGTLTLFR